MGFKRGYTPWNRGLKATQEHCKNISKNLKLLGENHPSKRIEVKRKIGEKNKENIKKLWQNPEYRKMMSDAHKGQHPVNEFKIGHKVNLGRKASDDKKRKISEANKGKIVPLERRKRISESMKGRKLSEIHRLRVSLAIQGKKHWNWNPNREIVKRNLRNDGFYQQWSKAVQKRDKECQLKSNNCSGYNIVHHIKGWASHPKLRYEINNGIVLCQFHHPKKRIDEEKFYPVFEELVRTKSIQ